MTQSNAEPDAQATGRWEDGRWVEQDEPSGEPDAPADAPEKTEPSEPVDGQPAQSSEESDDSAAPPVAGDAVEEDDKLLIPVVWERAAYAALFVGALIMRLWDLGVRAVHHDESLHGFFSWQIATGSGYEHNPLMHGMFLFHSVAGAFFLFGDNDFTLRLPMALFGSGLVLMPLLLRSRLGQVGALAAALMLAFSPAMLYFSRFARNDIFMAVFVLGLFAMIWRYIDERKNRYLYLAAAFLALGFTSKETMYLSALILVVGLLFIARSQVGNWLLGRLSLKEFGPAGRVLILLTALIAPLAGAMVAFLQEPLGITSGRKGRQRGGHTRRVSGWGRLGDSDCRNCRPGSSGHGGGAGLEPPRVAHFVGHLRRGFPDDVHQFLYPPRGSGHGSVAVVGLLACPARCGQGRAADVLLLHDPVRV